MKTVPFEVIMTASGTSVIVVVCVVIVVKF